ncbi:MAG: hypothetical protein AAGC97_20500, partial [Planctomycetota bacterium]
ARRAAKRSALSDSGVWSTTTKNLRSRCWLSGCSDSVYLLGVHLTPASVPPSETESWSARRGHLAINTHMWTIHRQSSDRIERFGIRFDVHTPSRSFRINDELHLRSYTPKQMQSTIGACGQWDIVQTHDFAYDLHDPIEVDSGTEDVVYVLRRR